MLSVAAAADNEERDENDPDPVVVEKTAKTAGVASTVRVHKKFLSAAVAAQKLMMNFGVRKIRAETMHLASVENNLHAVLHERCRYF